MLRNILGSGGPRVPGYEIVGPIAEGAFSLVCKGKAKADGKLVALKILNRKGCRLARKLQRTKGTLWEGELMASLDHPNIVKVYDFGRADRPEFIVMEYVESQTARFIARSKSDGQVHEKLDLLIQAARALEYVHDKGYLHRDLCSGNVLVTAGREVKLIDFGLAAHRSVSETQDWKAGTPSYMAPELIRTGQSTFATDIYSLGVIMYEFLTGVKPVRAADKFERMMKNLSAPVTPPRQHCAAVSPELETAILRAIAKEPEERFANMKEFLHTLVTLGIGGQPQAQLLPSGLDDGQVIDSNEQSIMAWAHSPAGIQSVAFHYSLDTHTWLPVGDPVPARPGRENIFGVDWDASALPEGTKVYVKADALDHAGRTASSDVIEAVVGKIAPRP